MRSVFGRLASGGSACIEPGRRLLKRTVEVNGVRMPARAEREAHRLQPLAMDAIRKYAGSPPPGVRGPLPIALLAVCGPVGLMDGIGAAGSRTESGGAEQTHLQGRCRFRAKSATHASENSGATGWRHTRRTSPLDDASQAFRK
jgi:hypothetical protein